MMHRFLCRLFKPLVRPQKTRTLRLEWLEFREVPSVGIRMVSYNIAASSGTGEPRSGLGTILLGIGSESTYAPAQPIDVLLLQEVKSQSTTTQNVVDMLNAEYGNGIYARGTFNGATTGAGTMGIVYRTDTLILQEELGVPVAVNGSNAPREPVRYKLQPIGADTSTAFYVYNSHYKSDDGSSDLARRQIEAVAIRSNADALGQGTNVFYVGDFNSYSSSEAFYQTLLSSGNGQAKDPINQPGSWAGNSTFRSIMTQAPSASPPSGLTGGGLDDRFDFQLFSHELTDAVGLEYVTGTYHVFGNNGSVPVNQSINSGNNTALPDLINRTTILTLLTTVTDHLPVVADYVVPSVATSPPTIGSFTINPTSIPSGGNLTLTAANLTAPGSSISNVAFYRDTNGVAGLQVGADLALGNGTSNGTAWSRSVNTAGLVAGNYTFFAVATNAAGNQSTSSAANATITASLPAISAFTINPSAVAAGGAVTLTAANVTSANGNITGVNFYRETNGNAGLQIGSDTFVGAGSNGGANWMVAISTFGFNPGSYLHYAVATDAANLASTALANTLVVTSPVSATAMLAWNVTGQGSYGSQGLGAGNVSLGVSNSLGLTRGAGVGNTGTAASNAWGGTSWATTFANGTTNDDTIRFGLTVAAGNTLSLSNITLNYRHSPTGPASGYWQYQIGANGTWALLGDFAGQFPNDTSSGAAMVPLDLTSTGALQNLSGNTTINFRLTPYGATSANGTWYVFDRAGNDLVVNGVVGIAPAITSANTTAFTTTSAGSFTIAASGSPTLVLTANGTLPSGVTFLDNGNGTASLAGTPSVGTSGTYTLLVNATNGIGNIASQAFSLVVNSPTTATLLASPASPATLGQSVSLTATITGGLAQPTGLVTFKDGATTLGNVTLGAGMNGVATLASITTLALGNHTLTAEYAGDIYHLASNGTSIYEIISAASPPTVTSLLINGNITPGSPNTVQSKLTSITVTFGQAVDIASGAFALAGTDPFNNAISVPLAGIIVTGSGTSVITLTFTGVSGVSFGSLNSGIWTLTVENTLVTAISGGPIMTADYTNSNIKRLFGDSNNDGFIDGTDEGAFGSTFGSSTLDAFYDATFDVNNDGFIDGTDESEFGATFGYNL